MHKLLVPWLLLELAAGGASGPRPECLMKPEHLVMRVPQRGFVRLGPEGSGSGCGAAPDRRWTRAGDLFVSSRGPSGSGRYWEVTVGLADKGEQHPHRGFCLQTSTVGWRTLPQPATVPVRWLDDQDGDGKPELIIWDSFPLAEEASQAEYGLVAWVYQAGPDGRFAIDWASSRRLARQLAAAYWKGGRIEEPETGMRSQRAARGLEAFAAGACAATPASRRSSGTPGKKE